MEHRGPILGPFLDVADPPAMNARHIKSAAVQELFNHAPPAFRQLPWLLRTLSKQEVRQRETISCLQHRIGASPELKRAAAGQLIAAQLLGGVSRGESS